MPDQTTPEQNAREIAIDTLGPLDVADADDAREWIDAEIDAAIEGIVDAANAIPMDTAAVMQNARYAAEMQRILDEIDAR